MTVKPFVNGKDRPYDHELEKPTEAVLAGYLEAIRATRDVDSIKASYLAARSYWVGKDTDPTIRRLRREITTAAALALS